MKRVIATTLFALVASTAGAREPDPKPDKPPEWLRRPTPADLMVVFPTKALERGVGGKALIGCKVSLQGALFDCVVLAEEPADMGFGQAALALTPQLQMKPALRDGRPVIGAIKMPIEFMGGGPTTGTHLRSPAIGSPFMRKFIGQPVWAAAPTYDEAVAAYPERAAEASVGGSATIKCQLTDTGGLRRCTTISESPRGYGFAKSARDLADRFQLAPVSEEVDLAGVETQYRVVFDPAMLDAARRVIGRPDWRSLPSPGDVGGGYPRKAVDDGVSSARVSMDCLVGAGGQVENCEVVSETPAGYGFGDAARALAPHFRLSVWTEEGLPTMGGRVTIPLRYEAPPAAPTPAAP